MLQKSKIYRHVQRGGREKRERKKERERERKIRREKRKKKRAKRAARAGERREQVGNKPSVLVRDEDGV